MADAKLSALAALAGNAVADGDLFYVDDVSVTTSKSITAAELRIAVGMAPGLVMPYAGSSVPFGWLLCNGQAVSQSTYAALYAILGTTYGSDAGGNFTLPDLTGRAVFGKEASQTRITAAISGINGGTLGATGGNQSMTAHTHAQAATTMLGNTTAPSTGGTFAGSTSQGGTTGSTGAGSSENMPPAMILNYIIKT